MRSLWDNITGTCELLRLAAISGFRLNSPYWKWRSQTAFADQPPAGRQRWAAILEYARWVHKIRRLTR
jgi:hypothetical protein